MSPRPGRPAAAPDDGRDEDRRDDAGAAGGAPDGGAGDAQAEAEACWPPRRTPVRLIRGQRSIEVRVVRVVDAGTLLCAVGDGGRERQLPPTGTVLQVQWADGNGLWTRSATLARSSYALVTLQSDEQVSKEQRRQFFRAPVAVDVTVRHGYRTSRGRTVDLSEGGALVHVPSEGGRPQSPLTTEVALGDHTVTIPGRIVRVDQVGDIDRIGIAFGAVSPPAADAIRREVITAQLDRLRKDHP